MAISKDFIKKNYPLPAYNYRVNIGGEPLAFSEVSGLAVQYEPITYKHGLSWQLGEEIRQGMKQSLRITLKKGLVRNGRFLLDWIGTEPTSISDKRDVVIDLCDESGVPVITWLVMSAVPLKLSAPTFGASLEDVAIESLEVIAHNMTVTFH